MQKSKIEWTDYVLNPVKGICKTGCLYCYAIKLYKRFKWNPEIRFDHSVFTGLNKLKTGSKVFVGSTHDIFGSWIPYKWITDILYYVRLFPKITFIFLTKNPKRYADFDFPLNAWIGYSTTDTLFHKWHERHNDNIKFVSLEPMAEPLTIKLNGYAQCIDFQWLIVGAETGNRKNKYIIKKEWIDDVIRFSNKTGIPLFIKNNVGIGLWYQRYPVKT